MSEMFADPFVGSLLFIGIGGTILGLLGSAIYQLAKYMRDEYDHD